MVKGINRSVIEINDTENQYIERAILFVNPKYVDRDTRRLNTLGKSYLKGLSLPDYCSKAGKYAKTSKLKSYSKVIKVLSAISMALIIAFAILLIIK